MNRNVVAYIMRNFAVICGVTTMAIGAGFFAGLSGGVLGGSTLGSVGFVFLGAGLFLYGRKVRALRPPGRILAIAVLVIAVLSGILSCLHLWFPEAEAQLTGRWPALPQPMALGTA